MKDNFVECWILDMDEFVREVSDGDLYLPLFFKEMFDEFLERFVDESTKG